jgi:hypothetical protein
MERFRRIALARQLAQSLTATSVGSAAPSGLFLSAPRRTGKSTFIREDLRPVLEEQGALALYVDLWANKKADPGAVIVEAVRAEVARHEGIVARLAKTAGMDKVALAGLSFSLDRVGLGKDISLSTALAALSDETQKLIVLLIDEAQHAITTESGYDALFALKAARDELNSSRHHGLRIVATGSNRDKLAMLRNSKDQAFFGAPLVNFPVLDIDFIAWFCRGVNLAGALDPAVVMELFQRAGFRPEILGAAADEVRFNFALPASDVPAAFAQAVEAQIEAADQQALRVIRALTPLQSAVLCVLATQGPDYAPFEAPTLALCERVLKQRWPAQSFKVDASNIQAVLTALQEKSLVWKEKRGVYSLEEASTLDLMRRHGLLPAWD